MDLVHAFVAGKSAISAQIYHKLSNKHMDRLILNIRERMGATCVNMRKTARYVTEMAAEHKTCVIGFIADQSPRKKKCVIFCISCIITPQC